MERIFYDGTCGLCHRGVRFVLARDAGRRFRFAPLGGPTFQREVDPAVVPDLPDSFVVLSEDGRVLLRSSGTVHVLFALGGIWRVLGALVWIVPRPIRDGVYDLVASVRKRLFAQPADTCPIVPEDQRRRIDP
ncbi:MAG TPA: DCC1-like thiol-disulfide oxidoreductase family protein [Candidatus Bathyarchaeia archaeon]|nr:DCC1-like thiol-disulfide oxidoreductase family protein [Candidatus Bathyarchaeia archaeon]